MLRALSLAFGAIAAVCMVVAIAWMVTDRHSARAGALIRLAAVLCFGLAVVLGILAH